MTESAATAIVIVSHSRDLARGVAELIAQMAPDVAVRPVGGGPDGGLGTNLPAVRDAVTALLDAGHEVLLTADLGSAFMIAEIVVELEHRPAGGRTVVAVDAPIARGTLAAAVEAQGGGSAEACARCAKEAVRGWIDDLEPVVVPEARRAAEPGTVTRTATTSRIRLADPDGIHARPAAAIVATLRAGHAEMLVDGRGATTLMELLALGARGGDELDLSVTGPAPEAVLADVVGILTHA